MAKIIEYFQIGTNLYLIKLDKRIKCTNCIQPKKELIFYTSSIKTDVEGNSFGLCIPCKINQIKNNDQVVKFKPQDLLNAIKQMKCDYSKDKLMAELI